MTNNQKVSEITKTKMPKKIAKKSAKVIYA